MDQIHPDRSAQPLAQQVFARPLGWAAFAIRGAEQTLWPLLDVVIRLWLAQVFFVSGVLKAANWENALNLAANEYPVSWLDPVAAAWLGVGIELGGSILLALGLFSRAAAAAMLILSLVIQFNYLAFDAHLFWAALFGWYVIRGAGPISLDRIAGPRSGRQCAAARGPYHPAGGSDHRLAGFSLPVGRAAVAGCGAAGCRGQCAQRNAAARLAQCAVAGPDRSPYSRGVAGARCAVARVRSRHAIDVAGSAGRDC